MSAVKATMKQPIISAARLPIALVALLIGFAAPASQCPAAIESPARTIQEPASRPAMVFRIYPLRNGACKLAGQHAFQGGNPNETYEYALYLFLLLGGEKPALIDAGLSDVAEMNRGAAHVFREPIQQAPDETSRAQLRKFGLRPEDIGYVFVTHLHFDHVDDLLNYTNARIYIGKKEWQGATAAAPTWGHGRILHEFMTNPQCQRRLVLVEDETLLPGIESFWIGGHTPGSMAYCIDTAQGQVVLTGDTVSLLANLERNIPPGVFTSSGECLTAYKKIRAKASLVLPSHDPTTLERWPPLPPGAPKYSIRAIKVGQCQVRDYITFQDSNSQQTSTYYLYVWLIEGGSHPILVETGPKYPAEFSRSTAQYIPGGVTQSPTERTLEALKHYGVAPEQVSYVIVTHLHADHYDFFDAFPRARLVVNKREYEEIAGLSPSGKDRLAPNVRAALDARPGALQLVEDEEIIPGIRLLPLGGHTVGSQGVLVRTHMGPALLAGDVVYKYENLEADRPTNSSDERAMRGAMARIRSLSDIILPAHDPLVLERWPGGVIGALGERTKMER